MNKMTLLKRINNSKIYFEGESKYVRLQITEKENPNNKGQFVKHLSYSIPLKKIELDLGIINEVKYRQKKDIGRVEICFRHEKNNYENQKIVVLAFNENLKNKLRELDPYKGHFRSPPFPEPPAFVASQRTLVSHRS